ncbi:MAG: ferredoxin [bacterium]|nr:ferredoxin [bacterium]
MRTLDDALLARLASHGLNLVGATSVAAYDARAGARTALAPRLPDARTAVVVGNGGGAFWTAFARSRPRDDVPVAHPLDAFTRRLVETIAADVAGLVGIVYPFDPVPTDFRTLAACAGLGSPSLLGLLVHPVYGPWMALRAALLVRDEVALPRPADGFDPCPSCTSRACIAACPGGAVRDAGWDVPACVSYRAAAPGRCDAGCHARLACVLGPEHRYPDAALAFHQGAARTMLARTRT